MLEEKGVDTSNARDAEENKTADVEIKKEEPTKPTLNTESIQPAA